MTHPVQYARGVMRMSFVSEKDFHKHLAANPDDSVAMGAYSDWLEENGRPALARVVRSHAAGRFPSAHRTLNRYVPLPVGGGPVMTVAESYEGATRGDVYMLTVRTPDAAARHRHFAWGTGYLPPHEAADIARGLREEGVADTPDTLRHFPPAE